MDARKNKILDAPDWGGADCGYETPWEKNSRESAELSARLAKQPARLVPAPTPAAQAIAVARFPRLHSVEERSNALKLLIAQAINRGDYFTRRDAWKHWPRDVGARECEMLAGTLAAYIAQEAGEPVKRVKRDKAIQPAPVCVARLSDGSTLRVSFEAERGKPISGAAGRNAARVIAAAGFVDVVQSHIEHNGERVTESFFADAPKKQIRRSVAADTLLADLLEWEASMGGFDATVWANARSYMAKIRRAEMKECAA